MNNMRPRVCAAIIRNDSILMVHHRDEEREYWNLPGGGIEPGETSHEAVIREVKEETGLDTRVCRFLFEETYLNESSTCQCFLLEVEEGQEAALGYDSEEAHLPTTTRLLQSVPPDADQPAPRGDVEG
jgi:8-oxo-dGTP pyrophosphatase MutT (NUDIX family)